MCGNRVLRAKIYKRSQCLDEASTENSKRVYAALEQFGAPITTMTAEDFAVPGFFFQMGMPPCRIDILMSLPGLDFVQAWNKKTTTSIDGLEVLFISAEDLLANKKIVGRPQDLIDVANL